MIPSVSYQYTIIFTQDPYCNLFDLRFNVAYSNWPMLFKYIISITNGSYCVW
jgi:hypothetical protein